MSADRLYNLLPSVYRARDAAQGQPLRALLAIVEEQIELVEQDIENLYDGWFVETAAEWLLPYIGDLLGVANLHAIDSVAGFSLRAYIANTLRYRQRKGTAAVLEQLANDLTNWEARVVEFFQLLATTQHVNHIRGANARTPDLRNANALELIDTPFDAAAHTAELRRIVTRSGRYNIGNVALFLWRLQTYPMQQTTPRALIDPSDGRFHFNPLGLDAPIFNRPQAEASIEAIAGERNVPAPLRRRALDAGKATFLDGAEPPLAIHWDGPTTRLASQQIQICHLGEWDDPGWTPPASDGVARVAVDPALGRFVTLEDAAFTPPTDLRVSYSYGFSADIGGGPYSRNDGLQRELTAWPWLRQVAQDGSADFTTLTAAVAAWNAEPDGTQGVIVVSDSATYTEELVAANAIMVGSGSTLLLLAAQPVSGDRLDAVNVRPHLRGNLSVVGSSAASDPNPGALLLDGLLIEGELRVLRGDLGHLGVRHCTVMPGAARLRATSNSNSRLTIALERVICGGITLNETVLRLSVEGCIVDAAAAAAITAPGATITIESSTLFGANDALDTPSIRELHASNTIFSGRVVVERRQQGCVRFCSLPPDSRTPRRYRCLPDLALENVASAPLRANIILATRPRFTSRRFGDPGYAQLATASAQLLRTGAEYGSEIGAFRFLKQPQREANLRAALNEYLPFGLQANLLFVN